MNAATVRHILDTMESMFPDAHCELHHSNAFELTIAVLLSAQCTDETVNKVTRDLFQKYKTPLDYVSVPIEELEQDIRRIGLYRNKAKHIQNLCRILIEQYGGEVPEAHDELVKLPGVGRKTANVVVSIIGSFFSDGITARLKIRNARYAHCWMFAVKERNV